MSQTTQNIFIVLYLIIPIVVLVFFIFYLKKKRQNLIEKYTDESSKRYNNLVVWFKNFNIFKRTNFLTSYSYNDCDIILNENNFIIIGKAPLPGFHIDQFSSTIFIYNTNNEKINPPRVLIESVQEVGLDLEIEFTDSSYLNKMTLVIKKVDNELKEKILTSYQKHHPKTSIS